MQRGKWQAAMQPAMVVPGVIFGVGCLAVYVLSVAVQGALIERFLPTLCGLVVGALAMFTFARVRDAYVVTAAVYSAVGCIITTLALPDPARFGVSALCFGTALACVAAYLALPNAAPITVAVKERDRR